MARKTISVKLDGKEYKLRITMHGMKALQEEFHDTPASIIMTAVNDSAMMCSVLTQALTWKGNENEFDDGEEFYDMLVDGGYVGQAKLGGLMIDLAVSSGLMEQKDGDKVKKQIADSVAKAYDSIGGVMEEALEQISGGEAKANPQKA